jgi:enoyl-CoA hydratase
MADIDDVLLVDVAERIATITLNRPHARNALNDGLQRSLARVAGELDRDTAVDVVVITGADPSFCAGLDLKELSTGVLDISDLVGDPNRRQGPLPHIAKPVIGAINGAAVTGGLELALSCDFLIASDRARFADTHARIGVQPGWGLTVLLPQAVGLRRAKEMSATGHYVSAATALDWGLVNHVVPHEELLPYCKRLAAAIVSNDSAGVRAILGTYDEGSERTAGEAWTIEARNARSWLEQGGGRSEDTAARRSAVQAWGRSQASG